MKTATTTPDDRNTSLPDARMALILLLTINFFNYFDRQVLSAVVPKIQDEFFAGGKLKGGVGDETAQALLNWMKDTLKFEPEKALIGSLALAFMAAYMLLAPLFGWLAERYPRWPLVAFGVLLWSLATGGSGLAVSFGLLFLTRCFVGVGEAAYGPVAPAMISDYYPVSKRGQVLAWFYVAIPVGSALGYVGGGQIAAWTGDWRWAFYIAVIPGIILGAWCFCMKEPPRGQSDLGQTASPPRKAKLRDYGIILRNPSYMLCTLGMTAMTFALGGIGFWMPYYIYRFRQGADLDTANTYFGAIVVIAGLAATLLGGWAGDKLRNKYPGAYFLVSGAAMLVGFPISVAMLYVPFPWAWVLIFLACFALFFNTGPTNTILANVIHPSLRASAFALNILVIHALGDAISPMIMGLLADAYDMHVAFLFVSFLILLGGLLWLWGARYLARDTELAPTRAPAA
jgi:MFS family permease